MLNDSVQLSRITAIAILTLHNCAQFPEVCAELSGALVGNGSCHLQEYDQTSKCHKVNSPKELQQHGAMCLQTENKPQIN